MNLSPFTLLRRFWFASIKRQVMLSFAAVSVAVMSLFGYGILEQERDFLRKHAHARDRETFLAMVRRLHGPQDRSRIGPADFQVLVPAFLTSELKEAFLIGFFLFVPFLVIDLVVSNILLALGMHMLSPTTISLPFKFLLFVLVDGWYLLTRGLVAGYQ